MVLVLALVVLAATVLLLGPLALTVGHWQVRLPRLALTLWFGAFFTGIGAAVGSVVAAIGAALDAGSASGEGGVIATVVAWSSLIGIGAVIAVVAAASEPLAGTHRSEVDALVPLVVSRQQRKGFVLGRIRDERPIACAVPGAEPMILVSSGLEAVLAPAELQAVLAHERAHLRGRHHWAVRIAQVNASCLPSFLPAGSALRRATRLLVELVADDAAARQAGAAHLANALSALAVATGDAGMTLRAERLALRRWRRVAPARVPAAIRVEA